MQSRDSVELLPKILDETKCLHLVVRKRKCTIHGAGHVISQLVLMLRVSARNPDVNDEAAGSKNIYICSWASG